MDEKKELPLLYYLVQNETLNIFLGKQELIRLSSVNN